MQKTTLKSSTLNVRIDPVVKSQSESILSQLGIPMSTAIEMYLRQVIIKNGLPFLPNLAAQARNIRLDALSPDELSGQFERGYTEYLHGEAVPVGDFRKEVAAWTNP